MKRIEFNSCFADKMEKFVNLRRLSGTEYKGQTMCLGYFDKFLVNEHFNKKYLTREIIQNYFVSISNLYIRTIDNYLGIVRQFCRYLSQFDSSQYIPEKIRAKAKYNSLRTPYIYSKDEIKNLLYQSARLSPQNPLCCSTYYTLFGLLYTTGIRIGEALGLNIEDFHPDLKLLHISEGKFHKVRWIPISSSTCKMLEKYLNLRQQTNKKTLDSPFFIDEAYKRLSYGAVSRTFHFLLKQCNIQINKDYKPRIHDIRHAFAIHRVVKWYREGEDVNALLPALATYMGHVNIASSQVYLQATSEMLEQGNQRFLNYFHKNIKNNGGYYE